jgi:signal transduction histidine kinase
MVSSLMMHLRLRTQLLIATVLLIGALTAAILLIVRYTVKAEVDRQVKAGIAASVEAFNSVQRQREAQLSRSAAMLAELPTLKALMTTEHAPTIQDGSAPFWKLAGSDLLALATNDGRLLALHITDRGWSNEIAARHLSDSLGRRIGSAWWYDEGKLYWVFLRPITAGAESNGIPLGTIAVGYQVDDTVAEQLARVAGSEIALASQDRIIASTLHEGSNGDLPKLLSSAGEANAIAQEVSVGGKRFEAASVLLQQGLPTPVRCIVLLPLARTTAFLQRLNQTIFALGIAAVLFATLLFTIISRAVTRPLDNLVAGVRALASGDYAYTINPQGSSEIAELGRAFASMRTRLMESQQHRIEAERIAVLGRTASSISHDLRHYLAAVVANAEFLYESNGYRSDRDEIYQEIKMASDQMTDLIDSLRELAREQGSITPVEASLDGTLRRAIEAVKARAEFRSCTVDVQTHGNMEGSFDPKKLERVFVNLILNACEATAGRQGRILVEARSSEQAFDVRIQDNGSGIPADIRNNLFDPFVSSGKQNGTGLGLAIVSKIVHDHFGEVLVEQTSEQGTVVLVRIPRHFPVERVARQTTLV